MAASDDVELTPEEIEAAIRDAKRKKSGQKRLEAYWNNVAKESPYPVLTAEALYERSVAAAKAQIPDFDFDQHVEVVYKKLALYFTRDARAEEHGLSLRKGLLMFGNIGCGKTSTMRLFAANQSQSYGIKSCREIANEYQAGGVASIQAYCNLKPTSRPDLYWGQQLIGCCFDDLGTETKKKNYANEANVMEEILLARYDQQARVPGIWAATHITTNLTPDEIESMYGPRVRSRMREMFNVIEFGESAPDRRK